MKYNSLFLISCITLNTATIIEACNICTRFIFPRKNTLLWVVFHRVIAFLNCHADDSIQRNVLRPTPQHHPLLASRGSSRSVISASSSAFVSSQETGGKNGSHCADFFAGQWFFRLVFGSFFLSSNAFNWKQQDNEGKQPVEIARPGCKTTIVKNYNS